MCTLFYLRIQLKDTTCGCVKEGWLCFPPPPHFISLHTHTLTMWKWDGKYQQVHAYTFTHRHAVRRLSCEYLQDGRLVYIFKTRSESHAALKSPLRALETHSGGLWKTHLFQKCHQSVSLDLWPVESKKKNPSITECGLCCLLVTLPDLTFFEVYVLLLAVPIFSNTHSKSV